MPKIKLKRASIRSEQEREAARVEAEFKADVEEAGGEFELLGPEAYAAQWGCDASYDSPPNRLGDGAMFYNYGSEHQVRDFRWLERFIGAIERTIAKIGTYAAHSDAEREENRRELTKLYNHVKHQADDALLEELQRVGP